MYFSKQLQKGVAVLIAVAACSDGAPPVVAPLQQGQQPTIPAGRIPDSDERVIVTRTIDAQGSAADGQARPPGERRTKTYTFGAGTMSVPHDSGLVVQGALKARVRAKVTSIDDLPMVGLTVPARRTSFRNAVVPWRLVIPMSDDSATVIESFGTGDAPPSMMRISRNGVTTMTIRQEWELWQRQWQLVRRETISPDSSFREVIDVKRTGRTGTALQSSADWSRTLGRGGALTPSFDIYGDEEGCGRCGKELIEAKAAGLQSVAKTAAAAAACALAPAAVTVPACVAALALAVDAAIDAVAAAMELDLCDRTAPPCPPKKSPTGECTRHAAGGHTLQASFTCGTGGGTGAGGGGSGGSSTPSYHIICTYYFEYDMETGEILYTELLYCSQVPD